MAFTIRPARPEDTPALFDVRTSVRENHQGVEELAALGITPASISAMIAAVPCAWVAVAYDRVVGFTMIDMDQGTLFAAFVRPECEGQGIGRALIARAETALFLRHASIWLETGRDSRAAAVYRHLGWGDETDLGGGNIRLTKARPA
ncbi:GNAT family N-acetyltransferase [Paracoccus sp. YIM 132242]|uniref:GNAT family N-acetyltransferase n=1 Tax=Paracoccus lichenicola TaxID=2665644 RepID=A0A6L6HKI9_9RHOB|nr:GNAT family N-acetyltransferase [Paracoccus lichenicola]MTD99635.1 GNAT family N-acetyltransferase [Paracoccus lichenicola]